MPEQQHTPVNANIPPPQYRSARLIKAYNIRTDLKLPVGSERYKGRVKQIQQLEADIRQGKRTNVVEYDLLDVRGYQPVRYALISGDDVEVRVCFVKPGKSGHVEYKRISSGAVATRSADLYESRIDSQFPVKTQGTRTSVFPVFNDNGSENGIQRILEDPVTLRSSTTPARPIIDSTEVALYLLAEQQRKKLPQTTEEYTAESTRLLHALQQRGLVDKTLTVNTVLRKAIVLPKDFDGFTLPYMTFLKSLGFDDATIRTAVGFSLTSALHTGQRLPAILYSILNNLDYATQNQIMGTAFRDFIQRAKTVKFEFGLPIDFSMTQPVSTQYNLVDRGIGPKALVRGIQLNVLAQPQHLVAGIINYQLPPQLRSLFKTHYVDTSQFDTGQIH